MASTRDQSKSKKDAFHDAVDDLFHGGRNRDLRESLESIERAVNGFAPLATTTRDKTFRGGRKKDLNSL